MRTLDEINEALDLLNVVIAEHETHGCAEWRLAVAQKDALLWAIKGDSLFSVLMDEVRESKKEGFSC